MSREFVNTCLFSAFFFGGLFSRVPWYPLWGGLGQPQCSLGPFGAQARHVPPDHARPAALAADDDVQGQS